MIGKFQTMVKSPLIQSVFYPILYHQVPQRWMKPVDVVARNILYHHQFLQYYHSQQQRIIGKNHSITCWTNASSTFNVCEHQLLPLMEDPPLELMIDQEVVPIANHTPIPIPIHWQDEVKAGLGRDVNLGVIEPVPFNDPVKWCYCMVIWPKKNGQLRCTIDLQNLNTYMQTGKLITLNLHFIRCELFHMVWKKLYLMPGMATTGDHEILVVAHRR